MKPHVLQSSIFLLSQAVVARMGCGQSSHTQSKTPAPRVLQADAVGWPARTDPSGVSIIIVDDEDINNRLMQRHVELIKGAEDAKDHGLRIRGIHTFTSPVDARLFLTNFPTDQRAIAFVDEIMPEMRGSSMVVSLMPIDNVVFLAATANVTHQHVERYIETGYSGILHKPFRKGAVHRAIWKFWEHPHTPGAQCREDPGAALDIT